MASDHREQDHQRPPSVPSALDLAAAVHDVRQMLAVISGRAGLLLERSGDEATRAHLQTIELAARDAGAMLARLGPVPGGAVSPPGSATSLSAAVEAAVMMVLPPEAAPGLAVQVAVTPDLTVAVPAQVMREVLNNLLLNSLAAMPDGGRLELAASSHEDRVILRVADTGSGIAPDRQDQVFEAGVSSSKKPGRGIGLAGCRRLLTANGARIELAETSATGTVFQLDLPTGGVVSKTAEQLDRPLMVAGRPLSVLVVDDDSAVRDMMTDLLAELGCRVTVVAEGRAAQAALAQQAVQVAFLDQNLPGMTGVEIASWIRETYPTIFLILVTGWGNDKLLHAAPDNLMDAAVEKPLTVGIIRGLLRLGLDHVDQAGTAL